MILLSTHLLVWALAKGEDVSYGAVGQISLMPPLPHPFGFLPRLPESRSPRAWGWGQPRIAVSGRS